MATDEAKDEQEPQPASPAVPGNAQGVPVPHEDPVEGTSEQQPAVEGVRTFSQIADEPETDDVPDAADSR